MADNAEQESNDQNRHSNDNLFRQEILDRYSQRLVGKVMLTQPLSYLIFVSLLMFIMLIIVVFMSVSEYSRKVRVTGVVTALEGMTDISAPYNATINTIKVANGQQVKVGQ